MFLETPRKKKFQESKFLIDPFRFSSSSIFFFLLFLLLLCLKLCCSSSRSVEFYGFASQAVKSKLRLMHTFFLQTLTSWLWYMTQKQEKRTAMNIFYFVLLQTTYNCNNLHMNYPTLSKL